MNFSTLQHLKLKTVFFDAVSLRNNLTEKICNQTGMEEALSSQQGGFCKGEIPCFKRVGIYEI